MWACACCSAPWEHSTSDCWGWPTALTTGYCIAWYRLAWPAILNASTGFLFVVSAPDQYLFNPAFQTKLGLMLLAGINLILFYSTAAGSVRNTDAAQPVLARARLMALVSLLAWTGVIIGGRLITYFRPPYHWCWGC